MQNENGNISTADNNEIDYTKIPEDFPRTGRLGVMPSTQQKLYVTQYKGINYCVGNTPPETYERWKICDDLAKQFAKSCIRTKKNERVDMSEEDILVQYFRRLVTSEWVTPLEGRWIMRHAAKIIEWPLLEFNKLPRYLEW